VSPKREKNVYVEDHDKDKVGGVARGRTEKDVRPERKGGKDSRGRPRPKRRKEKEESRFKGPKHVPRGIKTFP